MSRFLSFVLRHNPGVIGLTLDHGGWAEVDELIHRVNESGRSLNRELLRAVVAENAKKRFALSEDGSRIRAVQGHSIDVDLGLEPLQPPEVLFHGTATRFLNSILSQGLLKQSRQYVHLSADHGTAVNVGKRHGKVVVLEVAAGEMWRRKMPFYRSQNGVWLTEHVPPELLRQT